jgi:threonine/homoserine efflux transporter RhtA
MDGLQDIIGIVIACAAGMAFVMMIWAGQHQS